MGTTVQIEMSRKLHHNLKIVAKHMDKSVNELAVMLLEKGVTGSEYTSILYQPPKSEDWEEGC